MKTRPTLEWVRILKACAVQEAVAIYWAPAFAEVLRGNALSAGDAELDDFLGQLLHECRRLERTQEDLFYTTPGRLMAVWPNRFPTLDSTAPYLRQPQALAERVYGLRLGNTQPGDGWRYRGRGPIMVTGKANYAALSAVLGIDLVEHPDRLLEPQVGLRAAVRWWERSLPDALMGNLIAVTKRVNGGLTGLGERGAITAAAARALAS